VFKYIMRLYVTFHEFNHDSYGRGGLTRAERERVALNEEAIS